MGVMQAIKWGQGRSQDTTKLIVLLPKCRLIAPGLVGHRYYQVTEELYRNSVNKRAKKERELYILLSESDESHDIKIDTLSGGLLTSCDYLYPSFRPLPGN